VSGASPALHRYAVAVAVATFLLVCAGGLVTSTGSGLAVPDWPLSFGQVFPRMEGGVLFEHGHRMIAAAVGLLTVVLAFWIARVEPRGWVRGLGWAALAAVVLQGALGGLTVLMKLPDAVSVAHAGVAQVFFSITVVLALVTSPRWGRVAMRVEPAGAVSTRTLALVLVIAVYAQVIMGAVVRHSGAGLAIPDFPLAYGRLLPPFTSSLIAYHFAHRVGAVLVTALVVWVAFRVLRRHGSEALLRRPALLLVVLAAWQFFLGALTIWTRRAVVPTTAHVATGALLLATSVVLAVRAQVLVTAPGRAAERERSATAALG
jgi:cytochrome c oxidase assembly protein subunit 15